MIFLKFVILHKNKSLWSKKVIICYFCFVLWTLEKKLWLGGNIPIKVMIDHQDQKLFRLCIYMTCCSDIVSYLLLIRASVLYVLCLFNPQVLEDRTLSGTPECPSYLITIKKCFINNIYIYPCNTYVYYTRPNHYIKTGLWFGRV